ncbi:MAG: sensor histidine kinase, partial [Marivirga sp.]|nr:sensor histidine kinase [Marivirga sp.]
DDLRSRIDFVSYLLLILFFYLNFFVLVPRLYFKNEYLYFGLAVTICFLVIAFLPDVLVPFKPMAHRPPPKPRGGFFMLKPGNVFLPFLLVFFFSLMLKISSRWKQTEKQKLSAELAYLKAQINPHFLFNTLNSIYSLAIIKSDHTAPAIVKLSGMMRYVINEAHQDYVSLEKEVSYIRSYIDLQKIRFGEAIHISFTVNGDTAGRTIAPLILISFVENAFKHGVNAEENSDIKIRIDISGDDLNLEVSNNKVFVQHTDENKSGLGIENTKSRLQLLYPSRHQLTIKNNETDFIVLLELKLK